MRRETDKVKHSSQTYKRRRGELQRFVDRFGAKASKATQAQSRVKMIAKIRALEEGIHVTNEERSVGFNIPVGRKSPRDSSTY